MPLAEVRWTEVPQVPRSSPPPPRDGRLLHVTHAPCALCGDWLPIILPLRSIPSPPPLHLHALLPTSSRTQVSSRNPPFLSLDCYFERFVLLFDFPCSIWSTSPPSPLQSNHFSADSFAVCMVECLLIGCLFVKKFGDWAESAAYSHTAINTADGFRIMYQHACACGS